MPYPSDPKGLWRTVGRFAASALALLALTLPASAQTIRATVSADSVYVGERFTLSLVAVHRAATPASFPAAPTTSEDAFGDLVALDRTPVATRYLLPDSVRVDSVAYEVTTFALDTARVPALAVRLVAGADTVRAASAPLAIPVRSALPPDPQGLRGLAPLASFPRAVWPWVVLGLVALVLAAGLAYHWYRRRAARDEASAPAPAPQRPPYEAAKARLDRLATETDWNDPAGLERFYVELSTAVRTYVARRLGIAALERTTGELVRALRAAPDLPAPAVDAVRDVLEAADLVKFADRRPAGRDARAALSKAHTALDTLEQALRAHEAAASETQAAP